MGHDVLFPPRATLRMEGVAISPAGVAFDLTCRKPFASCPSCGSTSSRVHSTYQRTLDDLPTHGRRVRLRLTVRRFFCDHTGCAQRTFAERFDGLAKGCARKTGRLLEALCEIGFACGGEGGRRLASALGMFVSGDTLLNLIRPCPLPVVPERQVLGVDDWPGRRGQRYGTILCDLDRHCPVDPLAERSAESLSGWLAGHTDHAPKTHRMMGLAGQHGARMSIRSSAEVELAERPKTAGKWAIGAGRRNLAERAGFAKSVSATH